MQQLVAEGMPRGARGEYDLGQCMVWYIRYLQRALERRMESGGNEDVAEFTRERSRLAREQADRTALQNAEMRGDLCRLSVWQEELQRFLGEVRSAFLSLPTKVAPQLHGDTNDRRRVLAAAVNEILGHVAAYRPSKRTARSTAGDSGSSSRAAPTTELDGKRVGRPRAKAQQRKQRRARAVAD